MYCYSSHRSVLLPSWCLLWYIMIYKKKIDPSNQSVKTRPVMSSWSAPEGMWSPPRALMGCANSRAKDKQLIIPRNGDAKDRQRRSTVHINMSENIRELMLNSGRRTIVFFGKSLIILWFTSLFWMMVSARSEKGTMHLFHRLMNDTGKPDTVTSMGFPWGYIAAKCEEF